MSIIVYPGTFDPMTKGHIDLVMRAKKIFGTLIVAVAQSPRKKPFFTLNERIDMVKQCLQHLDIKVIGFSCLLAELLKQQKATVILRGLRAVSDFEYEFQMANMNRSMSPDVDSLFLTPAEQYSYISSSLVKEIASLKGDVSQFVNPHVAQLLHQKFQQSTKG